MTGELRSKVKHVHGVCSVWRVTEALGVENCVVCDV